MARYTFIERFVGEGEQTDEGYFVSGGRSTAVGDAMRKATREQPVNAERHVTSDDEPSAPMTFLSSWF